MNKLEKLIASLCPHGVEYKTLGELGEFYGGLVGKSKEDFVNGNAKFVSYTNVFTNPAVNVECEDRVRVSPEERQNIIKYGDVIFTGSSETQDECGMSSVLTICTDEKLYLNSFCFGYRVFDGCKFLPHFLKHLFRSTDIRKQICRTANGVTRFNVSKVKMSQVVIPVPPLPVQEEIVRMLDEMAGLIDELEQELVARKQQYEWYLDSYFRCSKAKRIAIKDIGVLTRGKRFVHADAVESGVPCVHYGEIYTRYGVFADVAQSNIRRELGSKMRYAHKNDVIIVGAGENSDDIGIGVSWEGDCDVAVHDACYTLVHAQNPRYVSYFLRSKIYHSQIKRFVSEGKICSISAEGVGRALIPIPIRSEQDAVAKSFDDFELLCREVLPSEIALRKQQYEYYRDRLLTFKRVG